MQISKHNHVHHNPNMFKVFNEYLKIWCSKSVFSMISDRHNRYLDNLIKSPKRVKSVYIYGIASCCIFEFIFYMRFTSNPILLSYLLTLCLATVCTQHVLYTRFFKQCHFFRISLKMAWNWTRCNVVFVYHSVNYHIVTRCYWMLVDNFFFFS